MSESSADILAQFNSLQQSGVLNSIEKYKKENADLERIISDTSQLITYANVDSMLDFMIARFLDYFIPQTLVFIIKPPRKTELRQYFYHQLVRTEEAVSVDYYTALKCFFDNQKIDELCGTAFPFSQIEKQFPKGSFRDDFKNLRPQLIVPLTGIGGVYGVVILGEKTLGGEYSSTELNYMHRIFSILAVTMQNGLHYETSITDPKTGLYTYDFFRTRLQEKIATIRRHGRTAGMLMLDIDHFKIFNDTWGHLAGDRVLTELSKVLQNTVRGDDCAARFGGEEFSILLTECRTDYLYAVAERIRKQISDIVLYENNDKLKITVSIGGCMIEAFDGITPESVFQKADRALYYSKENGRNRSTIFGTGLLERAEKATDKI